MKIAKAGGLGLNCWKSERFTGGECNGLDGCNYPEKRTCKAHKIAHRIYHKKVRIDTDGKETLISEGKGLGTK